MGLYLYQYQGPQSPPGPIKPPKGSTRHKPKMFSFGPTINCLTIYSLNISPEIQWAYTSTYIGAPLVPRGPTGPPGAHGCPPESP